MLFIKEIGMRQKGVELLGHISIILDPRMDRKKLHELKDILFLSISACLCVCDTWEDIHEFAEIQEEWLRNYIRLAHGIPSADTIARVFSLIDPEQFETAFRNFGYFHFIKWKKVKLLLLMESESEAATVTARLLSIWLERLSQKLV